MCMGHFELRYLQVDHRIPYEVAGDIDFEEKNINEYMLLCGSCNRAKSWSCEHCENWLENKSQKICSTCYWAKPENYTHIALKEIRRLDLIWEDEKIKIYEKLKREALKNNKKIPDYVKKIIEKQHNNNRL